MVLLLRDNGAAFLKCNSSDEYKDVVTLVDCNANLIMEPGELADFALGHKILINSSAHIVLLNKDESYLAKEGEYYYIFFPAKVDKQATFIDSDYHGTPVTNRRVSHLQTLPPI